MPHQDLMRRMSQRTTLLLQSLGLNPREVEEEITSKSVLVSLPEDQAQSENGQAMAFLALQLLLRLGIYCPKIYVHIPHDIPLLHRYLPLQRLPGADLEANLIFMVQELNYGRIHSTPQQFMSKPFDLTLSIGTNGEPVGQSTVYIASDGWRADVSSSAPASEQLDDHATNGSNPIGAYLAAILGANEVWKTLLWEFVQKRPEFQRVDSLAFSAFDYSVSNRCNRQAPNLSPPASIDLGDLILIGLGGIGSALIVGLMSLASSHQIRGRLILVDPDPFDWTNFNRHLLWEPGYVGWSKVRTAKRIAKKAVRGLRIHAHKVRYQDLPPSEIGEDALVVVGVDNEESRQAIQAHYQRILLGGYRELTSMVARIHVPYTACLGCFSALELTGNPADPAPSIGFSSALTGILLLGEVLKERCFRQRPENPPLNEERNVSIIGLEGAPHGGSLLSVPKASGCSRCG